MKKANTKKAVVLLSGGIDSSTAAMVARSEGYQLYSLTFKYGQRHEREIESARKVAASIGVVEHVVFSIDLNKIAASALTGYYKVPLDRSEAEIASGIPLTYVPARNIIFLAIALSYAETIGSRDIFIGVNQIDYSGYPDCRSEFIEAFERMANLGTKAGVEGDKFRIHTPLINLSKVEIVKLGTRLGLDYGLTWSCYLGDAKPCGRCDSCKLRLAAFERAGLHDPLEYLG
ncbi:MAG: 7-cyano-7-deazaguanine synthase QueC [Armatimonadota bacterium]